MHGAVDAIVSERMRHHIGGEAIGGRPAYASGWLLDSRDPDDIRPVEAAWLVIGDDEPLPLTLDRVRPDVTNTHRFVDPADEVTCGFFEEVLLPAAFGRRRCRIVARAADGVGLVGNHELTVLLTLAPLEEAPAHEERVLDVEASLILRDTVSTQWTYDRGPHSVRASGSMIVAGHTAVVGPRFLRVAGAGHERWFALDAQSIDPHAFRAVLSLEDCPIAGYEATLYAGTPARPVLSALFELADEHLFLPEALGRFRQPPDARWVELASAAVGPPQRSRALPGGRIVRGAPLWISGFGSDPAGGRPFLGVYACVDDRRPIPIPHWQDDEERRTAFAGVVDTARLAAGTHRLELLGVSALGNGVYGIATREFTIVDQTRYAPIDPVVLRAT